jgi:hypothetical protein
LINLLLLAADDFVQNPQRLLLERELTFDFVQTFIGHFGTSQVMLLLQEFIKAGKRPERAV